MSFLSDHSEYSWAKCDLDDPATNPEFEGSAANSDKEDAAAANPEIIDSTAKSEFESSTPNIDFEAINFASAAKERIGRREGEAG